MWQLLKNNFRYFVYFLASSLIFYSYVNYLNFDNLGTTGDFSYILDIKDTITRNLMMYDTPLSNGYIRYAPTTLSLMMPFAFFLLILSFIGIHGPTAVLVFISLMNFLMCISMDDWLRYFSLKKLKIIKSNNFILGTVTLLFCFAPQFSEYYKPGHFLFLIFLVVFPQILKYFDLLLLEFNFKYLAILGLLFFVSALPFGNLGIIAVLFGVLGFYSVTGLFLGLFKLGPVIKTNILVLICFILVNFWWLLPVVTNLSNLSELNSQSQSTIGSFISFATRNSSIINTLLGQPDNPLPYSTSTNIDFLFIYVEFIYLLILVIIFVYIAKTKDLHIKKYIFHILFLVFLAVYITMGPRAIFPYLFNYAYENIIGFQIFRRPASKIYWLYLFSTATLLAPILFGFLETNKYFKKAVYLILTVSSISFVIFYNFSSNLIPFKIPEAYKNIKLIPNIEDRGKVLLLPDLGGLFPYYDKSVNNLAGIDFVEQLSSNTYLTPSSTSWNLIDNQRFLINNLSQAIYSNKDYCELLGELNIGYIFVRQNLLPINKSFNVGIRDAQNVNLKNSPYVELVSGSDPKVLEIYRVKDSCFKNVFNANNFSVVSTKLAQSIYFLHFENISRDSVFTFLNDTTKNWDLFLIKPGNFRDCVHKYTYPDNKSTLCKDKLSITDLFSNISSFVLKSTGIEKRASTNDYFVTWNINSELIKSSSSSSLYTTNPDGTVNIDLVLWFKPLNYLIAGILVTVVSIITLFYLGFINKKNVK